MVNKACTDGARSVSKMKKTEIGVIPEDWDVRRLRETGTFFSTNSLSRVKLNYNNGTIYNIHYGDIHTQFKSHFNIQNEIVPFINNDIKPTTINLCKKGDLIIADASENDDDIGKAIEIINDGNKNIVAGLHTLHFRPFNDVFREGFLGHLWKTELMHLNILKEAQGTKVLGISVNRLLDLQIPLPPLAEQEAIASALSDADAWIESLEQLIAKKRLIKQGAMQTLLTPQEDWEVKKVREIAKVGRGRVISHKEINGSQKKKYPVYSSQTTNNGVMGFIDTYDFDGEYVTWTTDGEKAGTVFHRMGKFNCTNVCGTIQLVKDNAKFISYILGINTPKHVSRNLANPKLMNEPMKNIELPIPSLSEQDRIATILSDMDAELEALEAQLAKARQIKQGMMQELLTGRTRLV